MTASTYASFLVRLWNESGPEQPQWLEGLQGEIEHIQTSQRWTFRTMDELLGLMRRQTEASARSDW